MKWIILASVLVSNTVWACMDVTGVYEFRAHFMKLKQSGCESMDMGVKNKNGPNTEIIRFIFNNVASETHVLTVDDQGKLLGQRSVIAQASFDKNGFPIFMIDDPQSYDIITRSLIETRNEGSQIIQTNQYISRTTGQVMRTQSFYGVRK